MTRRSFIGELSAFGCLGFGSAFAAPSDFRVRAKGNLRFGVVSDPHVTLSLKDGCSFDWRLAYLGRWFERFRDARVDAVVIPGDLTSFASMRELTAVMNEWRRVFPNDRLPDGGRVDRVFILGNHDWEGWRYNDFADRFFPDPADRRREILPLDLVHNWSEVFGEEFRPFGVKTVKGYDFIQAHWIGRTDRRTCRGFDEDCLRGIGDFYATYRPDPEKPFFHVQHPVPKGTCNGAWAWGRDNGDSAKALSAFSNAFVLCGHSHYPITDERSIWQGAFTAVNCGTSSVPSRSIPVAGDGTDMAAKDGDRHVTVKGERELGHGAGLVFDVTDREIRITRFRDHSTKPVAEDWVVPVCSSQASPKSPPLRPYSFEVRKAAARAPAFPKNAKLTFAIAGKGDRRCLRVSFPRADARPSAWAMEYVLTLVAADGRARRERLLAPGAFKAADDPLVASEPAYELPLAVGEAYVRAEMRPLGVFGNCGEKLEAKGNWES